MENKSIIKSKQVKGKNRRVNIFKLKDNKTNAISYYVHTKRLINFQDRTITETKNIYSKESLTMLMVGIHNILKDDTKTT